MANLSKKLSRRELLKVAGLAAGAARLASWPAAPAHAAAPAVGTRRRLHFLRWNSFVAAEDRWHAEYLQENWAKPNNVELVIESMAMNDLQAKLSVALESGTGPDIVHLQHNWSHLYSPKLLDVSSICEKQGKDGGGFYDVAKAFSFVKDTWRSVPFGVLGNLEIYRTDWMKEIGEGKFPDTWQEFNRVSKLMKDKKKIPAGQAIAHSSSDPNNFCYLWTWSFGGKEVLADGKTVAINSKETVAAVEYMVQFFKDSLAPDMLGWDDTSNNRAYLGEQVWSTLNGSSIYLVAKKDFPKVAEVSDHAPVPRGPAGRFCMGYNYNYAIPSYVKDPAPAKELLAFMVAPKTYASFLNVSAGYTSGPTRNQEKDPVWGKDPKLVLFKDVSYYKWPGFPGPPSAPASEAMSKYIIVDMYSKAIQGMEPKKAVEWAETELKAIYGKA